MVAADVVVVLGDVVVDVVVVIVGDVVVVVAVVASWCSSLCCWMR